MGIHLLTCLTLTALSCYVVALKFFALNSVPVTADQSRHRVVAQAKQGPSS